MNAQTETMSLGQLISTKRKAHGFTQFDLADKLRVSEQAVSKWERDLSRPSLRVSNQLTELLDITKADMTKAQQATPQKYKVLQLVGNYVTFGLTVVALVLSVVATVLLVLDQIDLKNALVMIGLAVVACVVLVFDLTDTKLGF